MAPLSPWSSLHCVAQMISSRTVVCRDIPCSGEARLEDGSPRPSQTSAVWLSQGGWWRRVVSCAVAKLMCWRGPSSFSAPLIAIFRVTNCPCPSNQRNMKLARGPKYISWQQDKRSGLRSLCKENISSIYSSVLFSDARSKAITAWEMPPGGKSLLVLGL